MVLQITFFEVIKHLVEKVLFFLLILQILLRKRWLFLNIVVVAELFDLVKEIIVGLIILEILILMGWRRLLLVLIVTILI